MPSLRRVIDPLQLLPRAAHLATATAGVAAEALAGSGLALLERALGTRTAGEAAELIVARVLESDQLWLVVEEVAQSPAVARAIARQGEGLADQVAEDVGRRARGADADLERAARRLLRRRPPGVMPQSR